MRNVASNAQARRVLEEIEDVLTIVAPENRNKYCQEEYEEIIRENPKIWKMGDIKESIQRIHDKYFDQVQMGIIEVVRGSWKCEGFLFQVANQHPCSRSQNA